MRSGKKSTTATGLGGKQAKLSLWKRLLRGTLVVAIAVVLLLLILLGIILVPNLLAQLEGKISPKRSSKTKSRGPIESTGQHMFCPIPVL